MADNRVDMLSRPATGLKVVAFQRDHGWHVVLSETKRNNAGHFMPTVLARACVRMPPRTGEWRVIDQCRAMILGLDYILHDVQTNCNAL